MIDWLADFAPDLLRGMAVNFEIASLALLVGCVASVPLVLARLRGGLAGIVAAAVVALLWAMPTFVVMFFLANVVPNEWELFGVTVPFSGLVVIVLSQAVFATAYVADNGLEAMRQWRRGAVGSALLFLPNVLRAFFVMVTSSSQAAAIGVVEAVTVTLRKADQLHGVGPKLLLFMVVVMLFVGLQRLAFAVIGRLRGTLARSYGIRAA